ncbi:MAG: transporter [Gammaproteobacteria bacterium]|nr:MAG: transporter [Gammaproteobacteria bacterium]RKZ94157.1 MAG: transporter [Gammaproteobacteria bacterium]RKZ96810.1 MAG: transporter [Gammaproteobacteria bacterium]RLA00236.1 MAG: transporter [Gammaproteobacteria bacterium]HHA18860.1 TolC family protein [Methylophaga sp.]
MLNDNLFVTSYRYIIIIALTALMSACTTLGPDFEKPEVAVSEQWMDDENSAIDSKAEDIKAQWWTVFNDPVLDELIDTAYQQNLDLHIAATRIIEARAQLGIAVGSLYPQSQSLVGGATRDHVSQNSFGNFPGLDTSFTSYGVGFDAAWELDVWGRLARGIESADNSLLASVANYDDVLVSLTAEVAVAYVQVRTFEERIKLATQNEAIQQRSLTITEVRFNNGATTELDVTQAKALLHSTRALTHSLEIGLRQSKNALNTLLGLPPGDLSNILTKNGVIPAAPNEVAVGIPIEMLRRRPDIRQAELQAAAQSALIGVAEGELYPKFGLLGSFGLASNTTGNNNFGDFFSSDSIVATVGPVFSWSILNYGRIKNDVRVQDARYQQTIIRYQNSVLLAAREVEDAMVGFLKAQQQATELAVSVGSSNRSVDLSLIQYRDGVTDYTRVLNSQDFLVKQQDSYTAVRGEIALNLISMYKALGGGWEIREGQDFIPVDMREQMEQRTDWGELLDEDPADLKETIENKDAWRKPDW